jgi:hypothetical protein
VIKRWLNNYPSNATDEGVKLPAKKQTGIKRRGRQPSRRWEVSKPTISRRARIVFRFRFGFLLCGQLFIEPNLDQRLASNSAQGGFSIEFG